MPKYAVIETQPPHTYIFVSVGVLSPYLLCIIWEQILFELGLKLFELAVYK